MDLTISLREVAADDLPIFFEQQANPASTALSAVPARDQGAFTAHWAKILVDESVILRTIEWQGQVAGYMVSFVLNEKRQVGYLLGQEFWGRGIATQALAEFLKIVKVRPLYAEAAKRNPASRRVLEKCGFQVTGENLWSPDSQGNEVEALVLTLQASQSEPAG